MANNIDVTPGTGATFKTTDNAGVHTGHVNVDNTVTVDGSGVTQPVSGTVTANLSATDNAVLDAIEADTTTLAGAVSGSEMQVDVITSALPTDAATATLQAAGNSDLVAIKDAVETIDNAIAGTEMQVNVIDALPTGSNTIGTVNLSATDNAVLDNIEAGIDELKVLVGEVQESPTANTVLDRLKDIEAAVENGSASSTTAIEPQAYETVAASQTDQTLGATGATGDYLAHVLIVPGTTSPGAVSIKDGAGSAITIFTGGTDSVGSLVPFSVPINAVSGAGAWSITTGADVSAIAVGTFT